MSRSVVDMLSCIGSRIFLNPFENAMEISEAKYDIFASRCRVGLFTWLFLLSDISSLRHVFKV